MSTSTNKRRPWHRRGLDRNSALLEKFVPNGFGNTERNVTTNANSQAERGITAHEIHPYVQESIQRARDAQDIFRILPDLGYAASLGTASILSTDDLLTVALIYTSKSSKLSLEMRSRLSSKLEEVISNHVKLNDRLYDIVYNMRYVYGSYPIAILPEASVNDLINGDIAKIGREDYSGKLNFETYGLIGNPDGSTKVGVESYFSRNTVSKSATGFNADFNVKLDLGEANIDIPVKMSLTDNLQILRLPEIKRRRDSNFVQSAVLGHEAFQVSREPGYYDPIDEEKPDLDLFASKTFKQQHMLAIKSAGLSSRASVDRPTLLDLPAAACAPVHSPGTFTKPIGVLVALDELGHPISENNHYTTVLSNHIRKNVTSDNIDAVAKGMGVAKSRMYDWTERRLAELTRSMVVTKFINSLKNGNYGHDNVEVASSDAFIKTMLAAALSEKRCQILFIPIEQIAYFATDFDENGIGRSIVESTKILASMRVGSKFAALHASINNARSITTATIQLDPDDRDPEARIEKARNDLAASLNQPIPLNGSADDWNKHMANKGFVLNIEGNEHYPSTNTTISTENSRYEYPDSEQEEKNARDMYTAFGVNPAAILDASPIETATQVTVKDLQAAKVCMTEQERLAPLLTHFVKSYTYSDPLLLDELAKEAESVMYDRINAKRVNAARLLEKEQEEEQKAAEAANGEQEPAAEGDTANAEPAAAAAEATTEDTDQSDSEFAFESFGSYWGVGAESFVDFYTSTNEAVTADNIDFSNSSKGIKAIVSEFIATLEVTLPGPENAKLESAMEQLMARKAHYDEISNIIFPDGLYPEDSKMSGQESRLRTLWVSYELLNYMRKNNVAADAIKLLDYQEDTETLNEFIDDMVNRGNAAMVIGKNVSDRLSLQANALGLVEGDGDGDSGGWGDGGGSSWDNDNGDGDNTNTEGNDSQDDGELDFMADIGGGDGTGTEPEADNDADNKPEDKDQDENEISFP